MPKTDEETELRRQGGDSMVKSREEVLFANAKAEYEKAVITIERLIDGVIKSTPDFKYAVKDFLVDYDAYLQALLLKICSLNGSFGKTEMRFIEEIAKHGKLFDGTDLNYFADGSKEITDKLSEKAEEKLNEIPIFFKLSTAIDGAKNTSVSSAVFKETAKILFDFNLLKGNGADKKSVVISLNRLYAFLVSKGVKIN